MSIPPLYQGILNYSVNGITLKPTNWRGKTIENMKYCNGNKCGNVKPNGHIEMTLTTF